MKTTFIITCYSQTEEGIEEAFVEATNSILKGNTSGHDKNDEGSYYFKTNKED